MIPDVSTLPVGEVFVISRRFRAPLDLRAGGRLLYTMSAVTPGMVAVMRVNSMPVDTKAEITDAEVTTFTCLAYHHLVDFVPGMAPIGRLWRSISARWALRRIYL